MLRDSLGAIRPQTCAERTASPAAQAARTRSVHLDSGPERGRLLRGRNFPEAGRSRHAAFGIALGPGAWPIVMQSGSKAS